MALLDAYRALALVESEDTLDSSSSSSTRNHVNHHGRGSVVPSICAIRALIRLGRSSSARKEAARCLIRYPDPDDQAMVEKKLFIYAATYNGIICA